MSIHITLGISQLLRKDILNRLVTLAEKDPFFREPHNNSSYENQQELIDKVALIIKQICKQDIQYSNNEKFKDVEDLFANFYVLDNIETINEFSTLPITLRNSELNHLSSTERSALEFLADSSGHKVVAEKSSYNLSELKASFKSLARKGIITID